MKQRFDYEKVRKLLIERGIKQAWMAREVGMSANAFNRIVTGRSNPRPATITLLSRVLKIPENKFMKIE